MKMKNLDTKTEKSSREDPRATAGLVSNLPYFRATKQSNTTHFQSSDQVGFSPPEQERKRKVNKLEVELELGTVAP